MPNVGTATPSQNELEITGDLLLTEPATPKSWRRKRIRLIALVVIILAAIASGLGFWLTGSSPANGLEITTKVVKVTTGTIKQTVATSGTIEPASQASLNFAVSGVVTSVGVKVGQQVAQGQALASVSTTALQSEVDAAQAQLASAEERLSSDQSSGASSSALDSDEASVTSAQASLTSAQTSLSEATLSATIAGTVASVSLSVGQQVGSSGATSGSGAGSTAGTSSGSGGANAGVSAAAGSTSSTTSSAGSDITIVGTNSYLVSTTVDDTEVDQVSDGDQATITATGSTTPVYGTVASIGLVATESSNVATFPIVVDITGDPTGLYAGSTASVSITVKQLNNVVEVPTASITYNASGQATVTKVNNGKDVSTPVTVGAAGNGETQVTSGVVSGDSVVERVVKFTAPAGGTKAGVLGGTTGGFGGAGGFGGGGGGFGGAGGAAG
jgi:multidrug efflux pump subunit AcrA (membrane-fusion protein)